MSRKQAIKLGLNLLATIVIAYAVMPFVSKLFNEQHAPFSSPTLPFLFIFSYCGIVFIIFVSIAMKYIFDGRFKVIREIMHLIVFLSSGLFGFYFLSDRQDHTTLIVFLITATVLGGFRILN